MKILTVSLLLCAMMVLTRAAAVPEADPGKEAKPLVEEVVPEADPAKEAEPLPEEVVSEVDPVEEPEPLVKEAVLEADHSEVAEPLAEEVVSEADTAEEAELLAEEVFPEADPGEEAELLAEEGVLEADPDEEAELLAEQGVLEADPDEEAELLAEQVFPEADPGEEVELLDEEAFPEEAPVDMAEDEFKRGNNLKQCPKGWAHYGARCFLYVGARLKWANAERHCQFLRGNLASVHNLNEYQFIVGMIANLTRAHPLTWLGGYDATHEGAWFWSDGTPFTFAHWSPGQPDNFWWADCLLMNYGADLKFDDQPCYYQKPFLCAKRL